MFLTSDNQDDDVMVIKLKKGQSVKIVYEDLLSFNISV